MRRNERILIPAALVGAMSAKVAAQDVIDVRSIKPMMMLLVDTSGSMERKLDDQLPDCNEDPVQDADQRNTWAITLEALAGTIQDFKCKTIDRNNSADIASTAYDYGYYLPHFDFTTGAVVGSDGVLDAYKSRIKFGLMTFDGVGTTTGGDTLVPFTQWNNSNQPFWDNAYSAPGMYSYGPVKRLSFPGCEDEYGVNFGARGKDNGPGSLISVGSDDSGVTSGINDDIQEALLQVRPFGGTPTAAMLDDLRYYLQNDTDVKQGSDAYYQCRDRYAVFLTDGAPDKLFRDDRFKCQTPEGGLEGAPCAGADCECPYDTAPEIADQLVDSGLLNALYVVGFNIPENDNGTIAELNEISQAGNGEDAWFSSSANELRDVLDNMMTSVQRDATSRSVPVQVDTGTSVLLGGKQYEITAGFQLGANETDPWQGLLYRRRIGCDGANVSEDRLSETEGDLFHEVLNKQAARELFTFDVSTQAAASGRIYGADSLQTPAGVPATNVENDNAPLTGTLGTSATDDGSIVSAQDTVSEQRPVKDFDASLSASLFPTGADVNTIVSYVNGSSRPTRKLADIYHSNPTVLPPLVEGSRNLREGSERIVAWRRESVLSQARYASGGRPGVVFVGTNDGILHAFNLDTITIGGVQYQAGQELWGFIPPALFSKLPTASIPNHLFMFDGTPVVADVVTSRNLSSATSSASYMTALVAAVRGAPAFVALDVTFPEEPKPLWQFSDKAMGLTVGTPAITHVQIEWDGRLEQRAVAILPGGAGTELGGECDFLPDAAPVFGDPDVLGRDKVRCWSQRGRVLYVVDIQTGQLVQRFDYRHFTSPMTGSVAADGTDSGVSRAAYMTDQDGILWRLSMMNADPSKWRVQPVWDVFDNVVESGGVTPAKKGRPSTYPPLLSFDDNGNRVIVVGTGDVDNLIEENVRQRVVSLTEQLTDVGNDGELSGGMELNWRLELEDQESVTGPLVLFQEEVYFGSFIGPPGGNVCELGSARLWGLHYIDEDEVGSEEPLGVLPDPNYDPATGLPPTFLRYETVAENSLLVGVSIAREPLCLVGQLETDPNNYRTTMNGSEEVTRFRQTGAGGGGGYQMRGMIGGDGGSKIGGSQLREVRRDMALAKKTRMVGWAGSVE